MAAFLYGSPLSIVGVPGDIHTVQRNPLGIKVSGQDALGLYGEWIYAVGVASTVQGSWVNFDVTTSTPSTELLDTDAAGTVVGRIGVASAAIVASNYGWYQVYGQVSALSLTAATDAKNAFATSTAGSVDDANAGAETTVFGAFYVTAVDTPVSGQAYFVLNHPFMIGITLD
jgi:hypothetical protein